ncbi:unnamed protein product [Acanthoscelides obtectus]|uniref:MD-2-related lipid-recognition domain-containing protein n=1 Tax=Acanthoscelides obtectus TaxID=200917 RepID=A0A9P0LM50_ACAOB|nr:unnamed protein product [Acanthoscelides obtectus]CAK1625099.1 hypothetical protein AOBTE_LOCUS2952 [Acanthoscelides obtectus]
MELCDYKNPGSVRYLKYELVNRSTRALSIKMVLTSPLDSNVAMKIEVEKWGSSGWTKIPYLPVLPNACDTMRRFFSFYTTKIWREMGVKDPDRCPIPPGEYSVKNFIIMAPEADPLAVPVRGRVRVTISLVDMTTKNNILCIIMYGG